MEVTEVCSRRVVPMAALATNRHPEVVAEGLESRPKVAWVIVVIVAVAASNHRPAAADPNRHPMVVPVAAAVVASNHRLAVAADPSLHPMVVPVAVAVVASNHRLAVAVVPTAVVAADSSHHPVVVPTTVVASSRHPAVPTTVVASSRHPSEVVVTAAVVAVVASNRLLMAREPVVASSLRLVEVALTTVATVVSSHRRVEVAPIVAAGAASNHHPMAAAGPTMVVMVDFNHPTVAMVASSPHPMALEERVASNRHLMGVVEAEAFSLRKTVASRPRTVVKCRQTRALGGLKTHRRMGAPLVVCESESFSTLGEVVDTPKVAAAVVTHQVMAAVVTHQVAEAEATRKVEAGTRVEDFLLRHHHLQHFLQVSPVWIRLLSPWLG